MAKFAEGTDVSVEKSKAQIQTLIEKYGASGFQAGWSDEMEGKRVEWIVFKMDSWLVRFELAIPSRHDDRFRWAATANQHGTHRRRERTKEQRYTAWEKESRRLWRSFALAIKGKLEAAEAEITTFEAEFLAHIVMPNGEPLIRQVLPLVEEAYRSGKMPDFRGPLMLPAPPEEE